mgnify:FL=1
MVMVGSMVMQLSSRPRAMISYDRRWVFMQLGLAPVGSERLCRTVIGSVVHDASAVPCVGRCGGDHAAAKGQHHDCNHLVIHVLPLGWLLISRRVQ